MPFAATLIVALWIVALLAAIPYVVRARHPATKPVAAYLIFLMMFSVVSWGLFSALLILAELLGVEAFLHNVVGAMLLALMVFVPAFLAARWQLRKPPLRSPPVP